MPDSFRPDEKWTWCRVQQGEMRLASDTIANYLYGRSSYMYILLSLNYVQLEVGDGSYMYTGMYGYFTGTGPVDMLPFGCGLRTGNKETRQARLVVWGWRLNNKIASSAVIRITKIFDGDDQHGTLAMFCALCAADPPAPWAQHGTAYVQTFEVNIAHIRDSIPMNLGSWRPRRARV